MARTRVNKETTEAPPQGPSPTSIEKAIDASATLTGELEKADKQLAIDHARGLLFDSANRAAEKPIDDRYPALVERAFAPIDWGAIMDEFEAWNSLGIARTSEQFIRKAHEEGPEIIRKLYDVYLQVKFAREKWELENDVVLGGMREAANDALQGEKARGVRSKAITEADIEKQVATMFPDEWAKQESRRKQYKATEDRAKHNVEVANARQKTLDTMMNRLRAS